MRNKTIQEALSHLHRKGYYKTKDKIAEYLENGDLYYKQMDNNKFVVFNHYSKQSKEPLQGFDCWISEYNSADEIGFKKAKKIDTIKYSFDFQKDWDLLSKYDPSF